MDPLGEVRILEGQPSSHPDGVVARTCVRMPRASAPLGDVVKWLNTEVCKTSIQRFESARRLHHPSTAAGVGLDPQPDVRAM